MGANPVVIRRTMASLRNAGLVDSVKGHGVGWSIARDLKDISLLDIYWVLDEPILIQQHRGTEKPECLVEQTVGRALNETFQAAEGLIIERFKKIRLSDLSAEFHLLLERSRDGKRRRRAWRGKRPTWREFIAFGAATPATACAGVARESLQP